MLVLFFLEFWSDEIDKMFSIIKIGLHVAKPTVRGAAALNPPSPYTRNITYVMLGARCVINKRGIASFWK